MGPHIGITSRSAVRIPSYLLHKPSGQARVRLDGRGHYSGPFGSEESRVGPGQLIAQHASGISPTAVSQPVDKFAGKSSCPEAGLTINELVLAFMRFAKQHYRKAGKETSEVHCLKSATRWLVELCGFTEVDSFGPLMLKIVRQKMVDAGWVRYTCNKGVGRIRSVFKWGVENEHVNSATLAKLQAIAPLLSGRATAKDNPARLPTTDQQVEAVRPLVSPLVRDLIDVQRHTGARAGELLSLTPAKIDTTGNVWLFHVDGHKTEHHGHSRTIAIGPKAIEIVKRRMAGLKPNDCLFKIRRDSYTLAISRACKVLVEKFAAKDQTFVPWTPHQLRHAMGHQVREAFGLEHVQATLDHASFAMGEHYAHASLDKAIEVAGKVG
jgi:integrase